MEAAFNGISEYREYQMRSSAVPAILTPLSWQKTEQFGSGVLSVMQTVEWEQQLETRTIKRWAKRSSRNLQNLKSRKRCAVCNLQNFKHFQVVRIASGADHLILLDTEGSVWSMGCAENGQLGRVSLLTSSGKGASLLYVFIWRKNAKLCVFNNVLLNYFELFSNKQQFGHFFS